MNNFNLGIPGVNPAVQIRFDGATVTQQLVTQQLDVQDNVVGNLSVLGTVFAAAFVQNSTRESKSNIADFGSQEALDVLEHLNPVKFSYKESSKEAAKVERVGFIAEDVPESVASFDRKGVSFTDIVAILTQVVKEQQKTINSLVEKSHLLELAITGAHR